MLGLNGWAGLLFVIFLTLLLVHQRRRIQISGLFPALYFAMFRTAWGLRWMEEIGARCRGFFRRMSWLIVAIGFLGMALIIIELFAGLYRLVTQPVAPAGVGIIQPFYEGVPGTVFVPFFYFIISIFVIAVIHEFSHGVLARVWKVPVKSSGFAFLGIVLPVIPAAFVEPEEQELKKRPAKEQLSVFAAGPVSNIVLALLLLVVLGPILTPISEAMFVERGVQVHTFIDGNRTFPAERSSLQIGEVITAIDNVTITNYAEFNESMHQYVPGENVTVHTRNATHLITLTYHPDRENGFLGVNVRPYLEPRESFVQQYGAFIPAATRWLGGLFYWLFILNLGIGLFNLVPIGPIDGGRMVEVALKSWMPPAKAGWVWGRISMFTLCILFLNIALAIMK